MTSTKRVLVPVADASEDIELACTTDVLVRAGAEVTVASVMPNQLSVKLARGLKLTADCLIDDCIGQEWDAIALPGGMPGALRLAESPALSVLLQRQVEAKKLTAAICASPAVVLATHALIEGSWTCYPAPNFKEAQTGWVDSKVVVNGCVVTSQGPGTSLQFALKLVEILFGKPKSDELASALLTTAAG